MNDPNGLVFSDGEYHLFYQHNPFDNVWGHMSWGHAVSENLVHWTHLPLAIPEQGEIMAYSGSAVVDARNTSGFGEGGRPPLVAIYTGSDTARKIQDQRLAYSNDRGRTWTIYEGNPVLDLGLPEFRDPKVFWDERTERWVMVIVRAAEKRVEFYGSSNLKTWTLSGEFGPAGSVEGVWECPDLFPLTVEGGGGTSKWVLLVSVNAGAPAGGSGCQYFVGDFDGMTFVADDASAPLWLDFGSDNYAPVTWNDLPASDQRRILIGWMSNWTYAGYVPTSPWRSAMTVPRELGLRKTEAGLRLVQNPVREISHLRAERGWQFSGGTFVEAADWLGACGELPELLDVELAFSGFTKEMAFHLDIQTGAGERTVVSVNGAADQIVLDRSHSGLADFAEGFPARHAAPAFLESDALSLRILLDTSSIELFAQEGLVSLTDLIFPSSGPRFLRLAGASDSLPIVEKIFIHPLRRERCEPAQT